MGGDRVCDSKKPLDVFGWLVGLPTVDGGQGTGMQAKGWKISTRNRVETGSNAKIRHIRSSDDRFMYEYSISWAGELPYIGIYVK